MESVTAKTLSPKQSLVFLPLKQNESKMYCCLDYDI